MHHKAQNFSANLTQLIYVTSTSGLAEFAILMSKIVKFAKKICNGNNFYLFEKITLILSEIGVFHISKVIWIIYSIVAKLRIIKRQSFQDFHYVIFLVC